MDIIFNIAVSAANWALLAGYLVVSGTFTSLQSSEEVERAFASQQSRSDGIAHNPKSSITLYRLVSSPQWYCGFRMASAFSKAQR